MALEEYNRKRRFSQTPEPVGEVARGASGPLTFVVQLHHARARHYDLRLEVDGVLRSWAVPRGPSLRAGEKRLAVETEDHPLTYSHFSGIIPEGEYGAGHMVVFDQGTWEPEGDPSDAVRKGRVDFVLHGERLKGRWSLIRTRPRGSKAQWMLLKRTDEYASDLEADDLIGDLAAPPADAPGASTRAGLEIRENKGFGGATIKSPRTAKSRAGVRPAAETNGGAKTGARKKSVVEESPKTSSAVAAKAESPEAETHDAIVNGKVDARDLAALKRKARRLAAGARYPLGEFVEPMLAAAAATAPSGSDWIHEWKWDGYRLIAESGRTPLVWSRNGIPWNERAPKLVHMLRGLGVRAVLDGELIAVDKSGYSDFNALQNALSAKDSKALRYVAFDLLSLDGHDLRGAPLVERKDLLEQLLRGADDYFFYSSHIAGHGAEVFAASRERGMEGIISKRADARYENGRSRSWLKVKTAETRDFVVVGYTPPKASRHGIGALMLGHFRDGALVYAGRVGSGMGNTLLLDLHKRLKAIATDEAAVEVPRHVSLPAGRIQWVRPELVVEVFFRGWAKEGLVRQASFHRLREDKKATAKSLVEPEPTPATAPSKRAVAAGAATERTSDSGKAASEVAPDRKVVRRMAGAKKSVGKKPAATVAKNPAGKPTKTISKKTAGKVTTVSKKTPAKASTKSTAKSTKEPSGKSVGRGDVAAEPNAAPSSKGMPATKRTSTASGRAGAKATQDTMPQLSSPDRVVYPAEGYTKQDVFEYYRQAAPALLEEISRRPLSIVRCPSGIDGPHFFQKHTRAGLGAAVRDFTLIENDGDEATYFYVDNIEGLLSLVQMNALEFHPWGSHVDHLEQPDRIVFDLDPDTSIGWSDIKAAARDVRERLQQVGLESFAKLSGGKGVHVVVPIQPRAEWEQVRRFAEAVADAMEAEAPDRYVATMSKAKRKGRIFIDWLRNGRGATSVASWSLRARPGAPAAVPLTWEELSRIRSPQRYSLKDAAKRGVPDEVARIIGRAKPLQI